MSQVSIVGMHGLTSELTSVAKAGEATTGRAADIFDHAEAIGAVMKQQTVTRNTLEEKPGDAAIEAVVSHLQNQLAHLVA